MRIGVVFPQTELGGDVGGAAPTARGVEALGYGHLLAYDHVLGATPRCTPWRGPYTVATTFYEPFVMFGYLAGVTAIELVTGIIILPQRQTALVAKQAAEVDLLSGAASGSASAWAGTTSSTRRWASASTSGPAAVRADRAAAAAVDRAGGDLPGRLRHHHRRRPGPPAGAAPDPGVDRRSSDGLPPHRPAGDGWFPQVPPSDDLTKPGPIAAAAEAAGPHPGAGDAGPGALEPRTTPPASSARWARRDTSASHSRSTPSTPAIGADAHLAALARAETGLGGTRNPRHPPRLRLRTIATQPYQGV